MSLSGALVRERARRLSHSRRCTRLPTTALAIGLLAIPWRGPDVGPFDIPLFSTATAPAAQGSARLIFAESPFGVAVTATGHARYDVRITASKLPAPTALGNFHAYVAWAVTPDLSQWQRLGPVTNGASVVGHVELDKFLLVISAESDSAPASHSGPTVLHGNSPSSWLQMFLAHTALFHGVTD